MKNEHSFFIAILRFGPPQVFLLRQKKRFFIPK